MGKLGVTGSVLLRRMSNHTKYVEAATKMITHDCSCVFVIAVAWVSFGSLFHGISVLGSSSLKEGLLPGGIMKKQHY